VSVDIWRDTVSLRSVDGERRTLTLEDLKGEVGRARGRGAEDSEGDGA
jgi:hypothetical protein